MRLFFAAVFASFPDLSFQNHGFALPRYARAAMRSALLEPFFGSFVSEAGHGLSDLWGSTKKAGTKMRHLF